MSHPGADPAPRTLRRSSPVGDPSQATVYRVTVAAGAREVVARHGGEVPRDPGELRALPGIGPYSAGAIASIAYNVPAPAVDGNVVRVLSRLFALRGDPSKEPLKARLRELAAALIPA